MRAAPVADRIAFVGSSPTPQAYHAVAARDGGGLLSGPAWSTVLIVVMCSAAGLIAFLAWRLLYVSERRDRP